MERSPVEVALIAFIVLSFLGALLCLGALLALMRRRRLTLLEQTRHATVVTPRVALPDVPPPVPLETPAEVPTPAAVTQETELPEAYRLPVQEGTPEMVNIHIQPDKEPTLEQRNVRRLIDFLKRETQASEIVKVG
jgi:hypothetical protein